MPESNPAADECSSRRRHRRRGRAASGGAPVAAPPDGPGRVVCLVVASPVPARRHFLLSARDCGRRGCGAADRGHRGCRAPWDQPESLRLGAAVPLSGGDGLLRARGARGRPLPGSRLHDLLHEGGRAGGERVSPGHASGDRLRELRRLALLSVRRGHPLSPHRSVRAAGDELRHDRPGGAVDVRDRPDHAALSRSRPRPGSCAAPVAHRVGGGRSPEGSVDHLRNRSPGVGHRSAHGRTEAVCDGSVRARGPGGCPLPQERQVLFVRVSRVRVHRDRGLPAAPASADVPARDCGGAGGRQSF